MVFGPHIIWQNRFNRGVFGGKGWQIWFFICLSFWPLSPFCDKKAESF